jgi:hypothetical protein
MPSEHLTTIFREAVELCSELPENFRLAAFTKAIDVLASGISDTPSRPRHSRRYGASTGSAGANRAHQGGSRRTGPKSSLTQLVDEGFFSSKRSTSEIQSHLKDAKGHEYSSNELAISLLRLVRDKRLKRDKNADGQYEYRSE